MKKILRTGAYFAALPTLLLAGCSESVTSTNEESMLHQKSQLTLSEQHYAVAKAANSPRFTNGLPYQAIEPSESAQPLKTNYTDQQLAEMPRTQAHGGDTTRSVPLGQTLTKGAEDLSDGPLKDHRIVSYYGHPSSVNMGILGEHSPEVFMDKLVEQTKAYSELDPERPAIPAIELISTVAQRSPGEDGDYIVPTSDDQIEEYAQLAKEHNALLILDVQLARDTVMNQVKSLEKYLKMPHVHLAIDTEFQVKEGQVPGIDLGTVDGEEIQEAIDYVSNLAEDNGLPDKVVIVHQFAEKVLTNKDAIQPTENVEVVLNFDGHGIAGIKRAGYNEHVQKQPIQYGGFKVFYKKDEPLMTPKDVLELDPAPVFVNYQ
ncbi:hypothetical protein FZC84_00840 [Rossellomorea vietnamensis]|uniref:Lipoprotein n=1 Tax=Rossellomorea vietnamensis TaxID=218284 RepID=A0A5D4MHM4_9BACI|nr:hypothetical protein [Rossellomorea vietnamensis]TYS01243.1 hypothetical protein FZC84_00840 [Rossellomorea vietnamensis]